METKNVLIAGVGGQGIILASDVLSWALFGSGMDVKKNEIHGMSQREGSVVSFIRYGGKVFSPVIGTGEADFILAFEKLEALRNIDYLKPGGTVIINSMEIPSTPVIMGTAKYPEDIEGPFRKKTDSIKMVNALESAKSIGNARVGNIILLGVLSQYMKEVREEAWDNALTKFVKEGFLDANKKAFQAGRSL